MRPVKIVFSVKRNQMIKKLLTSQFYSCQLIVKLRFIYLYIKYDIRK